MAEIGCYDLKTLVTVPPLDTNRIVNVPPTQYFATSVLSTLSKYLLNGDSNVSNKAAKAINHLLKFRDGRTALGKSKSCQFLSIYIFHFISNYIGKDVKHIIGQQAIKWLS